MEVAEAPEGVKGDSANNVYKSATMTTGLVVQVPLFIKPGEKISVKTDRRFLSGPRKLSCPSFCSLKSPVRFVRMGLFSCRNPCPFFLFPEEGGYFSARYGMVPLWGESFFS